MAPRGAISCVSLLFSVFVMTMPDDHHPVAVVTMHAFVPAEIAVLAVLAKFGAGAAVMIAMPDHDSLGAGDRRRCNSDGAKGSNDVTKFLHDVFLS